MDRDARASYSQLSDSSKATPIAPWRVVDMSQLITGRPLQYAINVKGGPKAAQVWLGVPWGVGALASLSIRAGGSKPVSYTHLTLPTILRV